MKQVSPSTWVSKTEVYKNNPRRSFCIKIVHTKKWISEFLKNDPIKNFVTNSDNQNSSKISWNNNNRIKLGINYFRKEAPMFTLAPWCWLGQLAGSSVPSMQSRCPSHMALSGKHWPKSQEKSPGPLQSCEWGTGGMGLDSAPSHPSSSVLSKENFEIWVSVVILRNISEILLKQDCYPRAEFLNGGYILTLFLPQFGRDVSTCISEESRLSWQGISIKKVSTVSKY
jgi:hypothetical protein